MVVKLKAPDVLLPVGAGPEMMVGAGSAQLTRLTWLISTCVKVS